MGNKLVELMSALNTSSQEVLSDVLLLNFTVVNVIIVGAPEDKKWALVDTGLENSANYILESVQSRFGINSRPESIILTHGHFDHVGSVIKLSEYWDVPVYIHKLEMPYVTGKKDYPMGDPTVDEGLVAKLSPTFPHTSIDISNRVIALPDDGSVPGMSGWKWIHTPGHTIGHTSLFREKDGVIIVGDAFTTTKQESLFSVITHKEEINGPPKYLTENWLEANNSVKLLMELKPSIAIPSHGEPMQGEELTKHLEMLVEHFTEKAIPEELHFSDK